MTLGEWIPEYLTAYKLHTIKVNSYYSLELVARHIPQELKDMELEDIRPMHLQRFFKRLRPDGLQVLHGQNAGHGERSL